MKAITSLLLFLIVLPASFAQTRMIPHLTRTGGNFTSTIILCNTNADTASSYTLMPFDQDGIGMTAIEASLEAGETLSQSPSELFGSDDVSHFTIGDDDEIEVTVAYQDAGGTFSQAHVRDSSTQSPRYRIYPGDLDDVLDGLAIVNPNNTSLEVHARQVDAAGTVYQDMVIFDLDPHAKNTFVFTLQGFTRRSDTFYEVYATDSLVMTALRFATQSLYFWQTAATPLPMLVVEQTDPRIGNVAVFSGASPTYGVAFSAEIIDERTIHVTNFDYNANGPAVYFYVGQDLEFTAGYALGDLLRDNGMKYVDDEFTLTLPAGLTLDDFNSFSVWCVAFSVDFGSALFVDPEAKDE